MAGITFSEKMQGAFALGETNPEAGAVKGEREKTLLIIRASIEIEDLDQFIADPNHQGAISGSIDYPPLGQNLTSTSGAFNLFAPDVDDSKTKLMVYELSFDVDHQPHYFAGHKIVHDDPGFDLWIDTTTLFSKLHKGKDKSCPAIGAGVLKLGVPNLAALLKTFKAINVDSPQQATMTVAKFGRFFLGELWDTYS